MPKIHSDVAGGVAVLRISNPPVNALGQAVREQLLDLITRAQDDAAVEAIIITGEGKVFIAGADISEFGKPPLPPALPEVLDAIENSAKPVVAAINGLALGGGLEVALAGHARVASASARLGLPEVKLGLIPGAGGTQRLPRLIAPAAAFALMLDGEPVEAARALELGFVDVVAPGDLLETARDKALALARAGAWRRTGDASATLTEQAREDFEERAREALRRQPDAPNVAALMEAVRGVFELPFAEGLALERSRFRTLVDDPRAQALRYSFFAERKAGQVPGIGRETPRREIARAAVIGAGTMGGGIAMCFANAGIPVTVVEVAEDALRRGIGRVAALYESSVGRGSLSREEADRRTALIDGAVGYDAVADADIVVEAAFEDMGVKQEIFASLDRIAKPGAILATNTSYLDVNAIAAATQRPQDVIGLHFFSPANVMRLLEIVRPEATAADVVATCGDLGRKLGKVAVTVGVCFGFVGNRMLARRTAATERLLLAGALPHEIDDAITGFGFRMGPLAMGDLAGLDIGWRTRKAQGTRAPVADTLCELGRFGQKSGRGFYRYPENARKGERDPEVEALIAEIAQREGVERRSFSTEEIVARLLYPMVNEGARILAEKIAARPGDIDVIWVNGYNWPAWRGGPMYWADAVGLGVIAGQLTAFADREGDETLRPAPLLAELAEAGLTFRQWAEGA
ncbi:3-hydroxyacyl-CoA dehydrogenase [Pseudochelatococcus lubricantis]|uniref:3-hydroxyacyl-CoA dehydrogenase n=1 Tax=Pseudochelatococcus lubricantis TaxID=1538102 RepID=A0ABX0V1F0_9HYPH|nr:3-hydroxyacyl-CoA dehydrogenase NAD-binding domain-containing protein [Pseudochelatococcus lubricantis]NIJ57939.1 3-hydroxyacyl-CoA dehydrogenase [Pseudochelatococcus lubricantis]